VSVLADDNLVAHGNSQRLRDVDDRLRHGDVGARGSGIMVNARLRGVRNSVTSPSPRRTRLRLIAFAGARHRAKAPNQMSVARDLWHFHFALRHLLPAMHRDGT
jgi:hypothetical protein